MNEDSEFQTGCKSCLRTPHHYVTAQSLALETPDMKVHALNQDAILGTDASCNI